MHMWRGVCVWHESHTQPCTRQPRVSGGNGALCAPADEARCMHMWRGVRVAWHMSRTQPRMRQPRVSGGGHTVWAPADEARCVHIV